MLARTLESTCRHNSLHYKASLRAHTHTEGIHSHDLNEKMPRYGQKPIKFEEFLTPRFVGVLRFPIAYAHSRPYIYFCKVSILILFSMR